MKRITSFRFMPGDTVADKYTIVQRIGKGWEAEVFLVKEKLTGVERALKLFFPYRNRANKTLRYYAKKLHKLRHCPILIQYHTGVSLEYKEKEVWGLISEFVEGELLSQFIKRQPGKRLHAFQALHLLHALTVGIEEIHRKKEYHGDLHLENIIVERYGLGFDLKLVDLFEWQKHPKPENIQEDIYQLIAVFHAVLGGRQWYSKQPQVVRDICCGMRRPLILKKFRTSTKLRNYLETLQW